MAKHPIESLQTKSQVQCHSCGGAGVLRLGIDHYRTCLHCLAKGVEPAPLETIDFKRLGRQQLLSASVSSAK
jgi:DnaJ-class molecular chaperone